MASLTESDDGQDNAVFVARGQRTIFYNTTYLPSLLVVRGQGATKEKKKFHYLCHVTRDK
jgi:hypothetical protein